MYDRLSLFIVWAKSKKGWIRKLFTCQNKMNQWIRYKKFGKYKISSIHILRGKSGTSRKGEILMDFVQAELLKGVNFKIVEKEDGTPCLQV